MWTGDDLNNYDKSQNKITLIWEISTIQKTMQILNNSQHSNKHNKQISGDYHGAHSFHRQLCPFFETYDSITIFFNNNNNNNCRYT